jgi:hypothetical protein
MSFKPAGKTRGTTDLLYRTMPRKCNASGHEVVISIPETLVNSSGLTPGDRCMIEIDSDENLGRITNKKSQQGWLLKPRNSGSHVYRIRFAWQAESDLPLIDETTKVEVMQKGDGEIIFKLPTPTEET